MITYNQKIKLSQRSIKWSSFKNFKKSCSKLFSAGSNVHLFKNMVKSLRNIAVTPYFISKTFCVQEVKSSCFLNLKNPNKSKLWKGKGQITQNYKRNHCANFHIFLKWCLVRIRSRLSSIPPPPNPPWFHGFPKTPDKAYKLAKKPLPKKSMDKNVTQEFSAMP